MSLYAETFYAYKINQLYSEVNGIGQMLRVEAALAKAQAASGIIPKEAADIIAASARVDLIDLDKLKSEIKLGGNAAIPLVNQLTRIIKNNNFEASKYVHLGATSQDIIDTATMLTLKESLAWFEEKLLDLEVALLALAKTHRTTIMIGRTLLQQARPITFGLKVAGWLESITRSKLRLQSLKERVLQIQLGGAVGSGNANITSVVQEKFAALLDLQNGSPWQTQRDNLNEIATFFGILSGSLGKIAKDISLLMQTEVGEVFEGASEGKGGSSSMPHKRNPVSCALILANSTRTPNLVATMLSAMVQEYERAAGFWHAEWETMEQLMGLTAGSLEKTIDLIQNLEVDTDRMLANLEITHGLIYAELIALELSKTMGKIQAHELIQKACATAIKKGIHLKEVLTDMKLEIPQLERLFKPEGAIGNSVAWTEAIIKKYQ